MRRRLAAALILSAMTGLGIQFAPPVQAQQADLTNINDARQRVDLAGRQLMLSQRMAMAVCMLELDVEPEMHARMLAQAKVDFDNILKGLRDSDEDLGLIDIETRASVLRGFKPVEDGWTRLQKAVNVMALTGEFGAPFSDKVYAESEPLLNNVNALVASIARAHTWPASGTPARMVQSEIVQEQAMLTQKMAKEMCLVSLGWRGDSSRAALESSLHQFDRNHRALRFGTPVSAPATGRAADDTSLLLAIDAQWQTLRQVPEKILNGQPVPPAEVASFARQNEHLLSVLDTLRQEDGAI